MAKIFNSVSVWVEKKKMKEEYWLIHTFMKIEQTNNTQNKIKKVIILSIISCKCTPSYVKLLYRKLWHNYELVKKTIFFYELVKKTKLF